MAKEKAGFRFVNITLAFATELYVDDDLPTPEQLFVWVEQVSRSHHVRFGIKWNSDKQSYIVSATMFDPNGDGNDEICITQWGGSVYKALCKAWLILDVFGGKVDLQTATDGISDYEAKVQSHISQLMSKTPGKGSKKP